MLLTIGQRVPAFPHDDNRFRAVMIVSPVVSGGAIVAWRTAETTEAGAIAVSDSGSSNIANSAVQVSNASPTLLFAANGARQGFLISNTGPNPIFIGGPTVLTTTGTAIASGASYYVSAPYTGALYAIAATAAQVSPADTRILEYLT